MGAKENEESLPFVARTKSNRTTRPKPVYLWNSADVLKWFRRHCGDYYSEYADLLTKHGISGSSLLQLNEVMIREMGMVNNEHVQEIWRQIMKLKLKADIMELREFEKKKDMVWAP
ncbi:protein aveugle-like [Artemia franciscana]|uniref:SAM domain-containing protein n=1 Tax=Artemia franciscana TaxID=6661 RepID=A0AA88I2X5_ARTSF|nr:hypothetical protein QYM36_004415 [Artemia franciscana]KAK2720528.1 hypothetical protein QYM36_004415 [Artemia franciscana]KAK2720529.1 hypothetical protein QYM36_004415 [Artemia franciscana]